MPDFVDHASSNEAKFTEMAMASQLKRSVQTSQQERVQKCVDWREQGVGIHTLPSRAGVTK